METIKIATKEQSKLIAMFVKTLERKAVAKKHDKSLSYVNYVGAGSRHHDGILSDLLVRAEKNKNKFISGLNEQ